MEIVHQILKEAKKLNVAKNVSIEIYIKGSDGIVAEKYEVTSFDFLE